MVAPIGPRGGAQYIVLYTKSASGRIEERRLMQVNFSMMPGE
jgi:protein-L-isoaspartate O-methyltransferase